MPIQMVNIDGANRSVAQTFPNPAEAARAARQGGWCWPPIEGEPDSAPLLVAADILEFHLRDGDEALLCSADGARFVNLVPVS